MPRPMGQGQRWAGWSQWEQSYNEWNKVEQPKLQFNNWGTINNNQEFKQPWRIRTNGKSTTRTRTTNKGKAPVTTQCNGVTTNATVNGKRSKCKGNAMETTNAVWTMHLQTTTQSNNNRWTRQQITRKRNRNKMNVTSESLEWDLQAQQPKAHPTKSSSNVKM